MLIFGRSLIVTIFLMSSSSLVNANCPGETQYDLNQCAHALYQISDRRLNSVYKRLEPSDGLVRAQRAWIAYRDAQCAYEGQNFEGGSMQPMIISGCLETMTNDRIKLLEAIERQQ